MPKLKDNHARFVFAAFVIALLFPSIAFANGLTRLMTNEILHLFFLNLFIGVFEGLIIAFIFKVSKNRSMGIMILANYFSAWAGSMGIISQLSWLQKIVLAQTPLYNAAKFIVVIIILVFVLTVLLEWPFCYWILRQKPHRIRNSFLASLLVQTISYVILLWFYSGVSSLAIYKQLTIDHNLVLPDAPKYWVYFIGSDDGDIYRIHPDGAGQQKILVANVTIKNQNTTFFSGPCLYALPAKDGTHYDLWVSGSSFGDAGRKLLDKFATKACRAQYYTYEKKTYRPIILPDELIEASKYNRTICSTVDVQNMDTQDWVVHGGPWGANALEVENKKNNKKINISLEVPFLTWGGHCPTILPGDFVIFQLSNQIVLLDINNRKIRLITLGRGPVVTMD
jgi:hypothetical protein